MNLYNKHVVQFIVMIIVGVLFNAMNMLAYRISDIYFSLTLLYGGVLMASNMMWAHEIVHYFSMGHFNINIFMTGIILTIITSVYLLRDQLSIDDEQWLRRMISHHSTALTTTHKIIKKSKDPRVIQLSRDIIDTQEREITLMKSILHN